MATITSNGTGGGVWTTGSTWVGGVKPANNDAVVIAAGDVITYDEDMSGWANGIAGLTPGAGAVLDASTTAGNYYLKMAGSITASGAGAELRAGTSGTAYPTNCTFTIYMNGNYSIDGGASNTLTCKFYCYDPPVKYLRLTSAAPKAITGISKAATCTVTCVGHGYSAGDTIYIVNVGGMVELNNLRVKVKTVLTADTFTIRAYDADVVIDSTNFTTYTTGGYVCPETAEAAGQTQLEVDQDVSADAEWTRAGATINIDNVARAANSEASTIASVAAGSVTVTAGLTAAKHSSSLVILTSRNVTIQSSATAVSGLVSKGSGHVLRCAFKTGNSSSWAVATCSNSTISGVISGFNIAEINGTNNTFSGIISGAGTCAIYNGSRMVVSGIISGCASAIYNISIGGTISGTISGCVYAIQNGTGHLITGNIIGCSEAAYLTTGVIVYGKITGCSTGLTKTTGALFGARILGNTQDMTSAIGMEAHNTILGSSKENKSYNTSDILPFLCTQSFDHDKVAGAFRAWTRGGITSSTTSNPPTGRTRCYNHVCESASYPCWHQREILVEAGRQLRVRVWLKADVGVEIKSQLVLPTADPLITGTGTGEWQQIGTSDGAWHEYTTAWTNSASYPVTIYLRFLATAASGNGYSDFQWAFDRTPLVR